MRVCVCRIAGLLRTIRPLHCLLKRLRGARRLVIFEIHRLVVIIRAGIIIPKFVFLTLDGQSFNGSELSFCAGDLDSGQTNTIKPKRAQE